jgi:hypothetical protein
LPATQYQTKTTNPNIYIYDKVEKQYSLLKELKEFTEEDFRKYYYKSNANEKYIELEKFSDIKKKKISKVYYYDNNSEPPAYKEVAIDTLTQNNFTKYYLHTPEGGYYKIK